MQYTIRLLLPEGSLLLRHPDLAPHLGAYDPHGLTYRWTAADPAVDRLQAEVAGLVEEALGSGETTSAVYAQVREAAYAAAGRPAPPPAGRSRRRPPRLSEPWFCCAEPTERQFSATRNDLQSVAPSD